MIVACELGMADGGHVPFNAGILAMLRAAFPSEPLCFAGAAAHIEHVKVQLGPSVTGSISWLEIHVPRRGLSYARRLLAEITAIRRVLRVSPEGGCHHLLLTSSSPSTVVAAKIIRRVQAHAVRVQAILHGGLSGVSGPRHRHPVRRFEEMRTALTLLGNAGLQYLVLEDSVRTSLLRALPSLVGKVEVLEHPLPPNEGESTVNESWPPIQFGFLGVANHAKGFLSFTTLASAIGGEFPGKTAFHAIGRFQADENARPDVSALTTAPGTERLSRTEFRERVRQIHFIVLPHQSAGYEMNASGTLLDAIAWQKPVIARKIPIFEHMFERHGDIGYLFADDAELHQITRTLVEDFDHSRYRAQVARLQRARSDRTPTALAVTYRQICELAR